MRDHSLISSPAVLSMETGMPSWCPSPAAWWRAVIRCGWPWRTDGAGKIPA